jgi:hypothetical protein
MQHKQTFGNFVMIRLDKDNDLIKLKNGTELYIDTSFESEKHATVTGIVYGLPKRLSYTGIPNIGMPWKTPLELKMGDRVVIYYLAVVNALRPEMMRAVVEDGQKYIWTQYQNIFAAVRDGQIVPINGYCLIEPCDSPEISAQDKRMEKVGLTMYRSDKKSLTGVVYGKVKYLGRPNEAYVDGHTDEGVAINPGDTVVMKKISDLPLEYDLHANIDGGNKYWRVQRRYIFAKL